MFEKRCTENSTFEIRQLEGEGRKLFGTFVVYHSLSQDLGGFVERFMPGAITDAINSGNVTASLNHDDAQHIGSQQANTLRLFEDGTGAHAEITMPDTSYVRDFLALNNDKRQEHRGMSFGFRPSKGGQNWMTESGQRVREITKAELDHISPVINPAYRATSFNVRSLQDDPESIDCAERYGIDLDELSKIFVSIKRNLTLTEKEMQTAKYAVKLLRSKVSHPALEAAEARAATILL
jgi:HK97 family phage prohead protease